MLNFVVDRETCVQCGLCVPDCPAGIIAMGEDGCPSIAPDREASCYKCLHCLAICPTGSVSILGVTPEDCRPLEGHFPDPDQMEMLIKGRRSVRQYKDENLEPETIQRLLDVVRHAPTGVNTQQVLFTVVDDREKMATLRFEVMAGLRELARTGGFHGRMSFFYDFVRMWEENSVDVIFREAPHLLITSAPKDAPCPVPDCLIALSYFELFAQSLGVGTLWCGLAKYALDDLLPHMRSRLGIPEDHVVGYAMLFGKPAVRYARTVPRGPVQVNRFKG